MSTPQDKADNSLLKEYADIAGPLRHFIPAPPIVATAITRLRESEEIQIKTTLGTISRAKGDGWENLGEVSAFQLAQYTAEMGLKASRVYETIATATATFTVAASKLGPAINTLAQDLYRQHHPRLPGTLRTSRGRKKRQTKCLAWLARYLKQNEAK